MSEPASPEAEDHDAPGVTPLVAARRGFLGGLGAFGIVIAICVGIGMVEYAVSGGRYHTWTWVKVGFLYLLSSCEVPIRETLRGTLPGSRIEDVLVFRIPLLVGTFLIVWLVARASRRSLEGARGRAAFTGPLGAALGFAIPGVLLALPATLRFPFHLAPLEILVSAARWQAAARVPLVATAGAGVGVFLARRRRWEERSPRTARGLVWLDAGARMAGLALVLAFVGFLVIATIRPTQVKTYVRTVAGWGRAGPAVAAHHLLLLPDQSIWLLAPSMGGLTQVNLLLEGPLKQITISMTGITAVSTATPTRRLHLDALAYLLLLIPATATVLGGRGGARPGTAIRARLLDGAAAGVVFALWVGLGAWLSRAVLPYPPRGLPPVSIQAAMPSTALLALAWGVVGGALGAASTRRWPAAQPAVEPVQEPAAPEPD
jgi:hypothetical protein